MEKRIGSRVKKRVMASIDSKMCFTVDISPRGLQIASRSLPTNRQVTIRLQIGEKTFELNGKLRWTKEEITLQRGQRIGFAIDNPPPEYIDFLKSTGSSHLG
jgi:hypothetical protein